MMSIQQEASMPDKVARTDDDEVSTVSGGSEGGTVSLPNSPSKVWPETPTENPVVPPASLADLPSLGSLGHFVGQCSRCCFHPKGRCQNGYDCRFCHFEHEKRHRKKKITAHGMPVLQENHSIPHMHGKPATAKVYQQLELVPASGFDQEIQVGVTVPVECWSVEKVVDWLVSVELGHLSAKFQEHRITGDILLELSPGDLDEIGIHAVGDKKRFLRVVPQLRVSVPAPPPPPMLAPPAVQVQQQGNWCQPPCWDASAAAPPPPPLPPPPQPPYYGFTNSWSSPQHLGPQFAGLI